MKYLKLAFLISIFFLIGASSINADSASVTVTVYHNAACGSSNGGSFASKPTTELCDSTGKASSVTGSGPWSWTCNSVDGGAPASCSASKIAEAKLESFSVSGCTIPKSYASCPASVSWSTSGLEANKEFGIRKNRPVPDTVVSNAPSGKNVSDYIGEGTTNFYAYYDGKELGRSSATASCTSGTAWTNFQGTIACFPTYSLTLKTSGNGKGIVSGDGTSLKTGSTQTISATASTGSVFTGWSGGYYCSGTNPTISVSMFGDYTCTANFVLQATKYNLTVNKVVIGGATGTVGGGGSYDAGTTATATAVPGGGSSLSGWSGDCDSTGKVVMNSAKSCTATFVLNTAKKYNLKTSIDTSSTGSGSISGSGEYTEGTTAKVTATPDGNSTFTSWSDGCNGTSAATSVVMSADKNCIAKFTKKVGVTGNISSGDCQIPAYGNSCPSSVKWKTSGLVVGESVNVTKDLPSKTTVSAASSGDTKVYIDKGLTNFYLNYAEDPINSSFAKADCVDGTAWATIGTKGACYPMYKLTTSISGVGKGAVTAGGTYVTSTLVNLIATADAGSVFTSWSGDCKGTNPSASVIMYANKTCTANFALTGKPSGTISVAGCSIKANENTCTAKLKWSTGNLIPNAATEVTRDNPAKTSVSTATSGDSFSNTVNHGLSNFYLYHNGSPLGSTSITVGCVPGTIWDSTKNKCLVDPVVPPVVTPVATPVNGGWSDWSGGSDSCGDSGEVTRLCNRPSPKNGGTCLPDEYGMATSREYSNAACPVITDFKINGGNTPSSGSYPYNSMVTMTWGTQDIESCSCSYKDSISSGSCPSFGGISPYKTPALKKTTTYTLTCLNGDYSTNVSTKVPISPISTEYIEQ